MASDALPHAEVKVPPPLIYVLFFGIGCLLQRLVPLRFGTGSVEGLSIASITMMLAGFLVALWSALSLLHAGTPVIPTRPTTAVVGAGPYRWTRNPIYVGMLLLYGGAALWLDFVCPLLLLPILVLVIQTAVIRKEEQYLARRFGTDYENYVHRVRRWV